MTIRVEITNKFRKQVEKSADKQTKKKLSHIIQQVKSATSLSDIQKIKKLKGYKHTYRIRIGDYRVGIHIENDNVIFAAFDHRSDIYKYFP